METIDDIIEILKGKRKFKISIFCGAGISVKSGLPATSSLLEYILLNLGIEPADIKSLKHIDGKWVMPFESFMEAFIEHDKNTRLFNLFLLGRPNHNHFLIKMLAAHACLDEVYTTNFDLLIERIFEAAPKIDFKVVLENDADSQNHFQRDKIIPIIKLHGTADDVDTIRGTILSITSGVEFGNRMKMIQRAFYSSSDILWFWGYSFSDVFDINPAIELIQPNNKTIILLKHDPSITEINRAIIVPLEQTDADHPLRKFKGYMIRIDSDSLVQRILGKEFIQIEDTVKPSEWQAIIEEWIESFEYKHTKYSILCHLFYNTAQYDLALKYNRLAIQLNSGKDKRGEGASLSNKGMILYCLGRVTDALVAFHNAFKIFRSIDYSFGVTTCYINFGYVFGYNGKVDRGLEYIKIGMDYIKKRTFKESQLCKGFLLRTKGEINIIEEKFEDADKNFDLALEIFKLGFKAEESEVLMFKGKVRRLTGRIEESNEILKEAMTLATKTGRYDVVRKCSHLVLDK